MDINLDQFNAYEQYKNNNNLLLSVLSEEVIIEIKKRYDFYNLIFRGDKNEARKEV